MQSSRGCDGSRGERARREIVETAATLIAKAGVHRATAQEIAALLGISRGAVLYHFHTQECLLKAVIGHLQAGRQALLQQAAAGAPHGAARIDYAIDIYFQLLGEPAFKAFAELERAGRVEPVVRSLLEAAQNGFDQAEGDGTFDLVQGGSSARLQTSRDLARFTLEGLSAATFAYGAESRTANLVALVKRAVRMLNRKGAPETLWPHS